MPQARIGVIGGSGLYQMEGMSDVEEVAVQTPFGDPSDVITIGKVEGVPMAFLPRHGRGHRISPTEIPVRANIWALKSLGVEWVISVSAVGSLREHIAPRNLVIPNQLFDRTKSRVNTFFRGRHRCPRHVCRTILFNLKWPLALIGPRAGRRQSTRGWDLRLY